MIMSEKCEDCGKQATIRRPHDRFKDIGGGHYVFRGPYYYLCDNCAKIVDNFVRDANEIWDRLYPAKGKE